MLKGWGEMLHSFPDDLFCPFDHFETVTELS